MFNNEAARELTKKFTGLRLILESTFQCGHAADQ